MEEEKEQVGFGIEEVKPKEEEQVGDDTVLQFLDSADSYLTLYDSLSSALRQGWLDLASARHSMGTSRISSSLLDLKFHPASTSLQLTQPREEAQPQFVLRKWVSVDDHNDENTKEDVLREKSEEEVLPKQAPVKVDDQVQKARARALSVFGTLVSPKLRAAQLSFETALETLVEIANMRSAMLSAFDRIQKEVNAGTK